MEDNRRRFLELALHHGVLRFGEFTLKSGRVSPYFFDAGLFNTGQAIAALGRCYAHAAAHCEIPFDMLFGPAYKGIPLVAVTAAALAEHLDLDYPFAFNRKESKDHGEGGALVGAHLSGRVLIVDDVMTAGTAIRESVNIIRSAGASPAGVLIALDREERGRGAASAVQEVEATLGLPVAAIARLRDLIALLEERAEDRETLERVRAYRDEFGV